MATSKATTVLDRTVDDCLRRYADIANKLVCTKDPDQHELLRFELDVLHSSVSCYLENLRNTNTCVLPDTVEVFSGSEIV